MSAASNGIVSAGLTHWGTREIPYSVRFSPGQRNLAITVHPDLRVTVVAPEGRGVEEVAAGVQRKARWIAKQLRGYERWHPLPSPKRFIAGESHLYLGRQYRLKLLEGSLGVTAAAGRLVVRSKSKLASKEVQTVLEVWYRARAKVVFGRRLDKLRETAPRLVGPTSGFRIQRMPQRWGSCSSMGTLTLHPDLVKAPPSCIDYVLVHELCHRRVPNHSRGFYRLLGFYMPDWERRWEKLNRVRG